MAKSTKKVFNLTDKLLDALEQKDVEIKSASLGDALCSYSYELLTAKTAAHILSKKPNLLIFCALIDEANQVSKMIPGSVVLTGETKKEEREKILYRFKKGQIKCLINVGVLTTGFDYPQLEAVLMARSTMSLSLYYQIVGRAMRIWPSKDNAWIVDMGGNINLFGKIETMKIQQDSEGRFAIWNNGKQLTNVPFQK